MPSYTHSYVSFRVAQLTFLLLATFPDSLIMSMLHCFIITAELLGYLGKEELDDLLKYCFLNDQSVFALSEIEDCSLFKNLVIFKHFQEQSRYKWQVSKGDGSYFIGISSSLSGTKTQLEKWLKDVKSGKWKFVVLNDHVFDNKEMSHAPVAKYVESVLNNLFPKKSIFER